MDSAQQLDLLIGSLEAKERLFLENRLNAADLLKLVQGLHAFPAFVEPQKSEYFLLCKIIQLGDLTPALIEVVKQGSRDLRIYLYSNRQCPSEVISAALTEILQQLDEGKFTEQTRSAMDEAMMIFMNHSMTPALTTQINEHLQAYVAKNSWIAEYRYFYEGMKKLFTVDGRRGAHG